MKRYCKDVDITDRKFIRSAICECLQGGKNGKSKLNRRDTLRMFAEYSGLPYGMLKNIADNHDYSLFNSIIDTIADGIQQEILDRDYRWKPIWHSQRRENGKLRKIGIQDIKQQLYDYIAVNGLKELLDKKIGQYQCAAIPGRGQVYGKNAIRKWIKNPAIRYVWKGDAKHYYENIDKDRLKGLLKRYVKNEPLLHLVFALLDSFRKGLEIGSYLSQYLANFYMSFVYHYIEDLHKERRCRDGTVKRVWLVYHQLYYMDDIALFGRSRKDLTLAVRCLRKWAWDKLRIEIKAEDEWVDFRVGYIDMMGFCISRQKVIVRGRIFRRYRRGINQAKRDKIVSISAARALVSRNGWTQNAQCRHWIKRNKADQIIKLCKEMISNDKDVIRLAARAGHYHIAA